jgi:hypothetical protein
MANTTDSAEEAFFVAPYPTIMQNFNQLQFQLFPASAAHFGASSNLASNVVSNDHS